MSDEPDEIPGATTDRQRAIVRRMYRELLSAPVLENPATPVYHYTSVANLESILRSKVIWATDYRELNDTREFSVGDELVFDSVKASAVSPALTPDAQRFFRALVENYQHLSYTRLVGAVFVASFCERGDDASQWNKFGGNGDGVCVGLTWHPPDVILDGGHRIGATMLKVRYDKAELAQIIRNRLTFVVAGCLRYLSSAPPDDMEVIGKHGMLIAARSLTYLIPAIKLAAYQAEAERRIIALPASGAPPGLVRMRPDGRHYLQVPLTPNSQTPVVLHEVTTGWVGDARKRFANVQEILRGFGYSPTIARRSEIRERSAPGKSAADVAPGTRRRK